MKYKVVFVLVMLFMTGWGQLFGDGGEDFALKNAILVDLSQSSLSWDAGGFGLALGYERVLGEKLCFWWEGIYMHLPDDPQEPKALLAALGLRFYFVPPAIRGFFTGIYAMAGNTIQNKEDSFKAGIMAELGFAWRIGKTGRFILEPYIMYPYIFGEDPLIGIAPGLSLGFAF